MTRGVHTWVSLEQSTAHLCTQTENKRTVHLEQSHLSHVKMKTSSLRSSTLVLLGIFIVAAARSSMLKVHDNVDLVDQTCKQTPYYDLCVSSLESNPESSNTDLKGLALIMIGNVVGNTVDTLSFIEGLIKQTTDQQLEQSLAFCAELYIPVVKYSLPQAADAVNQGRFRFASDGISDAGKEADACDKKFSGSSGSPLGDRNKLVQELSAVAAAIVSLLLQA